MGTSTPFRGASPGSPLVPDFVDDDPGGPAPAPQDGDGDGEPPPAVPPAPPPRPVPLPPPVPDRFRSARANFSRFASSGGDDRRALGRAVSQYVSQAAGGSGNAARRMGSSRGAAARIASFLGDVATRGLQTALANFNLAGLAGRPATEILSALVEHICPEGGSIDEGIARDAFLETVVDLADAGVTDMANLTSEQMQTVLELYVAHTIEDRIYNDIGVRGVELPADVRAAEQVRDQLHDFIRGGVVDAFSEAAIDFTAIDPATIAQTIEQVYQSSFDILEALGEQEAGE
ncbi:Qat anti-phage system associated protein QatB [Sphingomonas sp. LM7]|uniref:Qat anti-phage system associated protein QatB n=1 Tax=Sphingomonas sp. LM7 TaxID=1938607 RepID=UPI000983F6FD|nr:Qat anti-phage system associated protein QatB [Sphingomonas sp. LM7]AQR74209.1 hypothetical protein BXU08_11590 [Sphingomonas sp. LM7]